MTSTLAQLSPVPGSILSNGLLVAVIALVHVQLATFLTGGTTLAAISEAIGMARGDSRHDRLAHGIITSEVYIFGFSSAVAIFWVIFILLGLWAIFWSALQLITFWVFVFEAATFLAEIVLLYTLYANWERLAGHRRARLGMLILLNLSQWWQMFFIDVVASFMVTPNGGDADLFSQILNPTQLPLTIHRTVGNIAWAGAAVTFYAGLRYLRATRRAPAVVPAPARSVGAQADAEYATSPEQKEIAHWEWVGQWGALWAVGMTLLQPWLGYSYAKEIQLHSYPAWYTMMLGDLSNVFLLQIGLLGLIFLLGGLYMWRRMKGSGARSRLQGFIVLLVLLMVLLAVQPAWFAGSYAAAVAAGGNQPWWQGGLLNPVGSFIPYKVGALFGMVVFTLWGLTRFLAAVSRGDVREHTTRRRDAVGLMALGITVSLMMAVMGVIREHARQPYLISGELTLNQQITNNAPSQTGQEQSQP